ncbi:glycosyltransferase family 1 protein [Candidatus Actinomarina sp. HD9-500m-PIT-SAG01]|nr:glycosyltransferase family 1 protein [Candidatus Actinomarina sp. HD9-500m-PIT-SAG01]
MKKVLVLNISTDSKNTSLGFAISWLNAFAKEFDEVHVVSLSKGSYDELEKNVIVSSVDNNRGRIAKVIYLFKLISKLTKSNKYEFCLSHMSSLMVIISKPILKIRKVKSIFWYTHKGPDDYFKKIFLLKASIYSNKIITASKNSFPYKGFFNNKNKLHVIGHAIKFDEFFRKIESFEIKDFVIISRISKSKKIEESISGFLNSKKGSNYKLSVIGGPLSSEDKIYFERLKLKYASHANISFLGSMPHKDLINEISDFSFHINNTEKGYYDKSVLETMSHGLINFYSNSDYDELLPKEYRDKFKFDGTPESLSDKITDIDNLKIDEINKIINFSQSKLEKQSVNSLVERVLTII